MIQRNWRIKTYHYCKKFKSKTSWLNRWKPLSRKLIDMSSSTSITRPRSTETVECKFFQNAMLNLVRGNTVKKAIQSWFKRMRYTQRRIKPTFSLLKSFKESCKRDAKSLPKLNNMVSIAWMRYKSSRKAAYWKTQWQSPKKQNLLQKK
jgi:hypothetical protein